MYCAVKFRSIQIMTEWIRLVKKEQGVNSNFQLGMATEASPSDPASLVLCGLYTSRPMIDEWFLGKFYKTGELSPQANVHDNQRRNLFLWGRVRQVKHRSTHATRVAHFFTIPTVNTGKTDLPPYRYIFSVLFLPFLKIWCISPIFSHNLAKKMPGGEFEMSY